MKIVVCPDSFKGSLPAWEVSSAIAKGIREVLPEAEILELPLADGGEGTAYILARATNGRLIKRKVTGPLGKPVDAHFAILGDGETAVVEMAQAAGLSLVPPRLRNPFKTTTRGVGELIRYALEEGVKRIIVGIGGSATTDAGVGMAQALGVRAVGKDGKDIPPGAEGLLELEHIDIGGLDERIKQVKIMVASDVANPLLDAARVYAPQKGAKMEDIPVLEEALLRFAEVVEKDLGKDIKDLPGGGAAGGLGAGLVALLDAQISPGIETIFQLIGFPEKIKDAQLIFTGEGKIDKQTTFGKAIAGVAKYAKGIPTIALAGWVEDEDALYDMGITAILGIAPKPMTLKQTMKQTPLLLQRTAREITKILKIGGMTL